VKVLKGAELQSQPRQQQFHYLDVCVSLLLRNGMSVEVKSNSAVGMTQ
jgi:hypothetical protein